MGKCDYKCSDSWISRFRKRHNIIFGKISGEQSSVNRDTCDDWLKNIWPRIREGYTDDEIFNADETALFYKMSPDKTLRFKGEKCSGGKLSKDRVTLLLTVNMTGTKKRKVLVVGKSKNPRCFKNVKSLPVSYEANKRAWMTGEIFERFLRQWNLELKRSNQKCLLLVDNCPAHPDVTNLSNIKLVFLPPNTTSVLQPLDQGIIKALKFHFRKTLVMKMIHNSELGKEYNVNLLDAIGMVSKAWDTISLDTIANCFRHAGFFLNPSENGSTENVDSSFDEEDDIPLADLMRLLKNIENETPSETWDAFVEVDRDVVTTGGTSDEQIVNEITNVENENSDDEDTVEEVVYQPPSVSEALNAVTIIRSFISFNNIEDDRLKVATTLLEGKLESLFLKSVSNCKTQSTITDYFNKS